jgi:hypothetical protein
MHIGTTDSRRGRVVIRRAGLVIALVLMVGPTNLFAGSSEGDRWTIGLDIQPSFIEAVEPDERTSPDAVFADKFAVGGALHVSYALSPAFRLRFHMSGADHGSTDPDMRFGLSRAGIEMVLVIRPKQAVRPYFCGGFTALKIEGEHDAYSYQGKGTGFVLGAGLYYRVGRRIDLHCSLRGNLIFLDENEAVITQPGGDSVTTDAPFDTWLFSGHLSGQVGVGVALRL